MCVFNTDPPVRAKPVTLTSENENWFCESQTMVLQEVRDNVNE